MRLTSVSFLLLACCLTSACALQDPNSSKSVYVEQSDNLVVETLDEQLDEKLLKYPTRFVVPVADGKTTLERAIFFFKNHTSTFTPQNPSVTAKNLNLTNEKSGDRNLYRVARVLTGEGFRYSVQAAAGRGNRQSALLAANLARFIREGQIEMGLLK